MLALRVRNIKDDKISKLRRKAMFYSEFFGSITTARLQVVAEKSGICSLGDNKFIDFFVSG